MPTGYTSDIYNGKKVEFSDFALKCARAFGACVQQRDDSPDHLPKLMDKSEQNKYTLKQLKGAENWKKPTLKEFKAYVKESCDYYKKEMKRMATLKKQYLDLLSKAEKWVPPTDGHNGLKQFMIDQLTSSIKHDCEADFHKTQLNYFQNLTYDQYIKQSEQENKEKIEYCKKDLDKTNNSVDNCNKWISELYKSLGRKIKD